MTEHQDELRRALDGLKADEFTMGPGFEKAHDICQSHEGRAEFDWIHALIHRIEGDSFNADYWYRRAGRQRHDGSFEAEWNIIRNTLLDR